MKVGDLVQVHPAKVGVYLVVRKIIVGDEDYPRSRASDEGTLWLLFGDDIGCAPMNEEWIEVINESG
jgi:hypothetical protein